MLRKLLSTLIFVFAAGSLAFAQSGSVTGTVTNAETGEVVPGANVYILEIERGAPTDAEGEYRVANIEPGTYTLRVTFVGYQTYRAQIQITSGEELVHDVELEEGAIGLDELVVTGYGQESKRELTGSISSVSSEDFQDVPSQNSTGILQGRAAGVQVTSTSGNAGSGMSVQIRGLGSINAGSQPLWIVDGVQISFSNQSEEISDSPLNAINPDDIQSIEVLKDASAAAIYGAQAANGVVLVTTKRGQTGDTQVQASYERGMRDDAHTLDYMNRDQWIEYNIDAFDYYRENVGSLGGLTGEEYFRATKIAGAGYPDPMNIAFSEVADVDWQEHVRRQGEAEKFNMSMSGGTESTRFRLSGGYEDTEDQIRDSGFQRYSARLNLDHEVSSKFSTRANISLSNSRYSGVCQDGYFINCPVSAATFEHPINAPYANGLVGVEDGEYNPYTRFGSIYNMELVINEVDRNTSTVQVLGDFQGTYNFTSWLSLTSQFGLDYRTTRDKRYDNPIARPASGGFINESEASTINFTTNTTLNFRQTFDDVHNISGLFGMEYRRDFTRELETTGQGFANKLFSVLNAAAEPTFTSGFENEFRVAGYFTNLKYNYDSRYFLSFTARYDGSSRFGADNRWGFFPSISGAWTISEESFFNVDVIDDLKVRLGYGQTGNSNIGLYEARGLYSVSGSYDGSSGLTASQLANPSLGWEQAEELNLGIDYSLFSGRLSGTIDVYQRDNRDLLLSSPLPGDSSFGSITRNVGVVRNEGIEFSFESVNVDAGDFLWSTNFNISTNRNEVLELTEGNDALRPSSIVPIQIGHSIRALNIEQWAGVNPADGRPMWYDADGNITYNPVIDDREFTDGGEQDFIGGLGNTFSYKGLSLNVFLQYSFGQKALPQQVFYFGIAQSMSSNVNGTVYAYENRWREPGDMAGVPAAKAGSSSYPGTTFYSNSSTNAFWNTNYVRVKRVRLGYSLPNSIVDRLNLSNVQLYVTGENLYTFTSYIGYDPEVAGGFTAASFPPARQINGGIRVQF